MTIHRVGDEPRCAAINNSVELHNYTFSEHRDRSPPCFSKDVTVVRTCLEWQVIGR